ncbi:hypothetical protein NL676_001215 [Syzygium grande]|nr:hypothetical protein NL676_001215 [Syzygium grande]
MCRSRHHLESSVPFARSETRAERQPSTGPDSAPVRLPRLPQLYKPRNWVLVIFFRATHSYLLAISANSSQFLSSLARRTRNNPTRIGRRLSRFATRRSFPEPLRRQQRLVSVPRLAFPEWAAVLDIGGDVARSSTVERVELGGVWGGFEKWSRRVATMLPWLVIPLIGLWALSQLLPPAFRFEITSPRLACVFVLLVTLFWYEILMPKLSAWRARRNAKLRERKKNEAIELQKLRKTATRRCRNCLTPYKDQNPGGGKFMCSYCGHISKRPVLDLPVPPGMGISNSGIIKDLVGKGGKLLNGRVWSDGGWMCGQDWLENGNWAGGSFATKSGSWRRTANRVFGGDDHCLAENSYSGVVIFSCKLLTSFFLSIRWLWRKIFRSSSLGEDAALDAEHRGMLTKRDGGNSYESRSEKARRKAEEKRQARLERELLEEEERKQREEVARLVEERRKLRDEKTEAEKDSGKGASPNKERDRRREAEKSVRKERKIETGAQVRATLMRKNWKEESARKVRESRTPTRRVWLIVNLKNPQQKV